VATRRPRASLGGVLGGVAWALDYAGPAPLTLGRVFTAWRVEPGVLAAMALLGGGYGFGLRYRWLAGRSWPRGRTVCFTLGLASIGVVGMSFLGVYDDTLFWVRAVQNIVLLMLTPMLLALGAPLRLVADLLPARMRGSLSAVLHSRPARVATFPLVVTVLLVVPLLVLYRSPLYELTLRSTVASAVSGLVVTGTGFVYFWTRFRVDPTPRSDSYAVTLWITIVEMIGDAVLGVVLWLGPLVAAGYYAAVARDWGPSLRVDQVVGAGVIWIGGDVLGLPFIAIVFARMRREDERHAAEIDAELDALDTARADTDPTARTGSDAAVQVSAPARLWWEDHPELSERFRRR
jgi:cytochrome c oxidase assembly factor CtaG